MKKAGWLGLVLMAAMPLGSARATDWPKEVERLNQRLHGKVVDYTANHRYDNRIWSRALEEKRDLYVYLPPKFDPHCRYPLVILLHGFIMDEHMLLDFAPLLDDAIAGGKLPPLIVAAPDGSVHGSAGLLSPGSFFLNSNAGDFEDFIIQDVWDFIVEHYPIRPERQAHVLAGVSMGGFAAYNLGIRHRDGFGVVVGVFPPLNLRWMSKDGNYFADFDPYDWGWRTHLNKREPIAHFLGGLVTLRTKQLIGPLFGTSDEALNEIMEQNPIELVDRYCLRNGELAMYVAYGGKDEFNIDAQVESFLYLAKHRGLCVGVGYDPKGRHNMKTAFKLFPGVIHWLAPILAPYSPQPACAMDPCLAAEVPCAAAVSLPPKELPPASQYLP